jgi:MoxR-like ATPase
VQTPWVEKVKNDVINFLDQGRSIFLWGETGSGKTELAKLIGEEYSNGYEIVRGHRFMTKEEILGYLGLTATEPPPPEKVPELIKKAVKKLKENNPELSDEELKNSNKIIEKVIIGQASDPVTITKFFWGPVYRAMKEGKVLIIDEANYIDPGLIANLNAIIANYRPGIKYPIPETGEEIEVKPGFAIIMTGNLNISEAEKYTKRYRLDPALRDRVKMIEYNTPPQEYRPENSFKEAGDRDLFLIALAELIDSKGNLILPGGEASLEKIWRLCQGFKVFQEIFAGKVLESDYQFNQEGRNIAVKIAENNLSLRKLINILSRWKKEGFSKTLDYYLWDEVIAQALSTPKEGAYFYQIFQKIYGFFQTPEWDQSPNYGTRGEIYFYYKHTGKIDKLISPEQRGLLPINLIDIVEAVSGEKIPEIEINISQEEKEKEMIRENIEFFEREYLYLETELKAKQNELNDYCSA